MDKKIKPKRSFSWTSLEEKSKRKKRQNRERESEDARVKNKKKEKEQRKRRTNTNRDDSTVEADDMFDKVLLSVLCFVGVQQEKTK